MNLNVARLLVFGISTLFLCLERMQMMTDLYLLPHIVTFGFLIFLARKEYKNAARHFLVSFFQNFYFLGMLVSSLLITGGAPMIEIGEIGMPNGTFWVLVIFYILGNAASAHAFNSDEVVQSGRRRLGLQLERQIVIGLVAFVLLASVMVLAIYSNPYSLGMDRILFWETVVPGTLSWVNSAVRQSIIFPILLFYTAGADRTRRRAAAAMIAAYLLITVVMLGEKASAFILYTSIWLVVLSAYEGRLKINRKVVLISSLALGAVYALVSYNYRVADYGDAFIITRIGLQAQVLWSALNTSEFPFFPQVAMHCFWGCGNSPTAPDFISARYLPAYLYELYSESGSTLSGFMPGLPILTFGFFTAILLHVIVSWLLGRVARNVIGQLRQNNIIYSFLIFKIYFAVVLYWYAAIHTAIHSVIFASTLLLVAFIHFVGGKRSLYDLGQVQLSK